MVEVMYDNLELNLKYMILTIVLIIPVAITIIILSYFMRKSIARKEWNTVWLQGVNIVNALIIISFILTVYFTIN